MEIDFLSRDDLWNISNLLLMERNRWCKLIDHIEHPYDDKRRKDKSPEAQKKIDACHAFVNYYCKLSNQFATLAETRKDE